MRQYKHSLRQGRIVGTQTPKGMMRKPKAWLNHIAALNPQLGAKAFK